MTSKEAWNKIKGMIIDTYGYEYEKDFEVIEKDLEVLEILKEEFKEQYNNNISGWVELNLYYEDNLDKKRTLNFKRIRKWLNNDII